MHELNLVVTTRSKSAEKDPVSLIITACIAFAYCILHTRMHSRVVIRKLGRIRTPLANYYKEKKQDKGEKSKDVG